MNKQLFEKQSNSYKPIYPLVRLEDIIDTISDKSIQWILNNYNHIYVEYSESVAVTRNKVPQLLRRTGIWISYNTGTEVVTEYYKGDNKDVNNFIKWTNDDNWERFDKIKHLDGSITYQHLSESLRQLIGQGNNITNFPDDEDLEVKDGLLKLKDRDFEPNNFSGLGRVILRKNIKTVDGQPKNVLTQDMINKSNTIYEIRYDFDLNGEEITIPEGCILDFQGGSFSNGSIVGNRTTITAYVFKIFDLTTDLKGTWNVSEAYPEWFGAIGDNISDDFCPLQKCIDSFDAITLSGKAYYVSNTIYINGRKTISGVNESRRNVSGSIIRTDYDGDLLQFIFTNGTILKHLYLIGKSSEDWNSLIGTAINFADVNKSGSYGFIVEDVSIKYFNVGILCSHSWNWSMRDIKIDTCYQGIVGNCTSSTLSSTAIYNTKIGVEIGGNTSTLTSIDFDSCEVGFNFTSGTFTISNCGWEFLSNDRYTYSTFIRSNGKVSLIVDNPYIWNGQALPNNRQILVELLEKGLSTRPVIIRNPNFQGTAKNNGIEGCDVIIPDDSEIGCVIIESPTAKSYISPNIINNPYVVILSDRNKNLLTCDVIINEIVKFETTITPNYDGTYTLNGPHDNNITGLTVGYFNMVKGNTYTLSGIPKDVSYDSAFMEVDYDGRTSSLYHKEGIDLVFVAEKTALASVNLFLKRNIIFENTIISPMICLTKESLNDGFRVREYTNEEITKKVLKLENKSGDKRPTNLSTKDVGFVFFDLTLGELGKPIYYVGKNAEGIDKWVDATGTEV